MARLFWIRCRHCWSISPAETNSTSTFTSRAKHNAVASGHADPVNSVNICIFLWDGNLYPFACKHCTNIFGHAHNCPSLETSKSTSSGKSRSPRLFFDPCLGTGIDKRGVLRRVWRCFLTGPASTHAFTCHRDVVMWQHVLVSTMYLACVLRFGRRLGKNEQSDSSFIVCLVLSQSIYQKETSSLLKTCWPLCSLQLWFKSLAPTPIPWLLFSQRQPKLCKIFGNYNIFYCTFSAVHFIGSPEPTTTGVKSSQGFPDL